MASRDEILRFIVETSGDKELVSLAKALDGVAKASEDAAPEAERLLSELERLTRLQDNITQFVKLKASLQETGDQLFLARDGLKRLNSEFSATDRSSSSVAKAFQSAEKAVSSLTEQERAQELALKKLDGALQKAGLDTSQLGNASSKLKDEQAALGSRIGEFQQQAQKSAASTRDAAAATAQLGKESSESIGLLGELSSHLGAIVAIASVVKAALGGIRFGTESVAAASAVEASLSRVQALAQSAAVSFDTLNAGVEDAARKVNVSTGQAAQALAELAAQGQSADDALKSLVPTLQLAKIANIDVAQAAGLVDDTLDQFGLGVEDAARVVDVLVAASKGGKDALGGISDALSKLAPLAKDAGLSFEDTAAALGLLTTNGISTRVATSGLQAVLEGLRTPASDLRVQLAALGASGTDFAGAIAALTADTPRSRDALLSLDSSAQRVILAFGQQGPGALASFRAGLDGAAGSASRTAQVLDDNLRGAATQFTNTLDRLGEALAQPILAPLKDEIVKLANELDAFAKTPAFDELRATIAQFAADGAKAFDTFIHGIDWQALLDGARTSLAGAADTLRQFGDAVGVLSTGVNVALQGVAAAFNGVKAVVQSFAAVAGAAISSVLQGLAALEKARAFVTFGDTAKVAEDNARSLQIAADAFYASAQRNLQDAGASAAAAGKHFEALGSALSNLPSAAASGTAAVRSIGDEAERAGVRVDNLTRLTAILPPSLRAMAEAAVQNASGFGQLITSAEDTARAVDKANLAAFNAARQSLPAAREAARQAAEEYARLLAAGNATPEAFAAAGAALSAASRHLADLEAQSGKTRAAAAALADDAKVLGITLSETLTKQAAAREAALDRLAGKLGQAGIASGDVQRAFEAWAASARDAVAQADATTQAETERLIAAKAALLGVADSANAASNAARSSAQAYSDAGTAATAGYGQAAEAARGADKASQDAADGAQRAAQEFSGAAAALTSAIASNRQEFLNLSQGAAEAFDSILFGLSKVQVSFNTQRAGGQLLQTIADAAALTRDKIEQQRQALQGTINTLDAVGQAGADAFGSLGQTAEQATRTLEGQIEAIKQGRTQFDLLGSEDLGRLQAALDQARQRVQALQQQAEQARQALEGLGSQLQDEIDQIRGDQRAIEDRRYQEQLRQIAEQAAKGDEAAKQAAERDRRLAEQLHQLKLQQIAEEERARSTSGGGGGGRGGGSTPGGGGSGGGGTGGGGGGAFGGAGTTAGSGTGSGTSARSGNNTVNVNLTISGPVIGGTQQEVAEQLARLILPQLNRLRSLGA